MKARIDRDELRRTLKAVLPAVGKANLPILNGVRIDTIEGNGLRLCCSDLQLTITADVDAKVLDDGALVVPARMLAKFVDKLGPGSVEIFMDDGHAVVTGGDTTADWHALPVDEWPRLPTPTGEVVDLTAPQVDLVRRILPFAGADDKRPVLGGLMLTGDRAVCTDSYALGEVTIPGLAFEDTIIPADVVVKALADAAGVGLQVGDRHASFHHHATTWTTVLIEGDIPPYERMIPTDPPHMLTVATADLLAAVGKCSTLDGHTDKNGHAPPLELRVDGDKVIVSGSVADVGSVTDVISCESDFDQALRFNPRYLAQLATSAGEDSITLRLVDSLKPATVVTENMRLLMMPIRPSV